MMEKWEKCLLQQTYILKIRDPQAGIYKRKQESKKGKHAFDQESDQKINKNDNGQEKKKENTLSTKKKNKQDNKNFTREKN